MAGRTRPAVLTIAGSDSSGGAGIQADLKTMMVYGVYGMSVITAITAQNTCGVFSVENISKEMLEGQLAAVFEDIFPNAVKIGMLSTKDAVLTIAECFEKYHPPHVILDPVMVSSSGRSLLDGEAKRYMKEKLFSLAELISPNIPEAEEITGRKIHSSKDMEEAAEQMYRQYGCNILIKGGHLSGTADDLLYTGKCIWYPAERIASNNTHGTGCTLSSAIASGLAVGLDLPESVEAAKDYVRGAMSSGLNLGRGNGPLDHGWTLIDVDKANR